MQDCEAMHDGDLNCVRVYGLFFCVSFFYQMFRQRSPKVLVTLKAEVRCLVQYELSNYWSLWNLHAQMQAQSRQNLSYFGQRCIAEVTNLHELIFVVRH